MPRDFDSVISRMQRTGWAVRPRDPGPIQTTIVRFLDYHDEIINRRPVRPGTIAEIDQYIAERRFAYRPFEFQKSGAQVEPATVDQLRAYEPLMQEVDENQVVTANDSLSQQLGMVPPETPKLIVRFVRHGGASDKRSCNPGEVWPVEMELALRHLLDKKPVVELASPDELKRDRDLVDQIEDRRKRWNQLRVRKEDPLLLVVRFVRPGKNSHGNSCNPGEVWEVDEDHAYRLCRGRSPVCELATEAELKAYRNRLTETSEPVEVTPPVNTDRLSTGWNESPIKPCDGIERKASLQGSDMRTDIVTTYCGRQYSVVEWLNDLNLGPFGGYWRTIHLSLLEVGTWIPESELSASTYRIILDASCVLYLCQIGYSRNVSDIIVKAMNLPTSTTAHDEALKMFDYLEGYLQVSGDGPQVSTWAHTERDKQKHYERWGRHPDATLLWNRKTELVCWEEFQRQIRTYGLPGEDQMWSHPAIFDLRNRMDVEECHLRTYLRTVPPAQAVALLSRHAIPGESTSSGGSPSAPKVPPRPEWDSESSTLRFNGEVIRTVRPIAKWRAILDTFHDDNWPPRIDNPLPGSVDLSAAIKRLNTNLSAIRFRRDDSGDGIMWEITVL